MLEQTAIVEISNRLVGEIARRTGAAVLSINAQCNYREIRHQNDAPFVTGCALKCANGLTISVQWGREGIYSNVGRGYIQPGDEPTVEIAVIRADGSFMQLDDYEGVMPYIPISIAHDVIVKYSELDTGVPCASESA